MTNVHGITEESLKTALNIKRQYKNKEPLILPGADDCMLMPENFMNSGFDLMDIGSPLPLAMIASLDPETPMALAAAARMCPLGGKTNLLKGILQVVGETSRHPLVRECLGFVSDSDFDPVTISEVRRHASRYIVKTRQQYTVALKQNLQLLLDGTIAPSLFVHDFFMLTEAGNMRNEIRKKLVLSLMLSGAVRPSVKFLMLENFGRLAKPVRRGIMAAVLKAEPTRHTEIIKEELMFMVAQEIDGFAKNNS
ncbi:MAG: hypothetical protein VX923_05865 [Pseudomonadota bacterium]|nr:hypothetical protein [Pseudomonadota bacterium]